MQALQNEEDNLYGPRELAGRLRVSSPTVYRWEEEGIIHAAFSVGATRRYRWGDVLDDLKRATEKKALAGRPNPRKTK